MAGGWIVFPLPVLCGLTSHSEVVVSVNDAFTLQLRGNVSTACRKTNLPKWPLGESGSQGDSSDEEQRLNESLWWERPPAADIHQAGKGRQIQVDFPPLRL